MKRLLVLVLLVGCPGSPAPSGAQRSGPADVERSVPSDAERSPSVDVDCMVDGDCALLPYATCCGECPPAPPFDVGTREDLDAVFIELETRCALDTRPCTTPTCDPVPKGCAAAAACVAGRCVIEQSDGCGTPRI